MEIIPLTEELEQKARLLNMAGDPVRIRILCLLFDEEEACVGSIASALNMSIAAISHHLQLMKDSGLLRSERQGQSVCYAVVENMTTNRLKEFICN